MNKRINDIEFRWLENRNPEIVQWYTQGNEENGEEFCCTLLWYSKDKEGYYVEFIGDRPFKYHDTEALWKLMKYGNAFCSITLDLEEE